MSSNSWSNQPIITQTQISCSALIVFYNKLFVKYILPFIREISKNWKNVFEKLFWQTFYLYFDNIFNRYYINIYFCKDAIIDLFIE